MTGLSVTIIAKDEAARIAACLESVAWAEEIVVVDAQSTDHTVEIARSFTPHVHVRAWPGYAAQKTFALERATQRWVLSLDADEAVTPELAAEIREVLRADGPLDGYHVPRKNVFLGRWIRHGTWYPDHQLRLFRREAGWFPDLSVHESVRVRGRVGHLRAPILHQSYDGIADFVGRSDRYSTLAAGDLVRRGRRVTWATLVLRPLGRFLSMYVLHRGFLDGRHGLVLAALYGYYVFMREAKAWELSGRTRSAPADEAARAPDPRR